MRDAAVWGTATMGGIARRDAASWTSGSWAARWARSSARRSPGPPSTPSRTRVPLDRRRRLRRGPDAGGHAGAHAAGQDARRPRAAARRRRAVHQRPVRPDDRRRLRLVRGGRRRQRRRARTRSSASPGRGSPRARSPRSCRRASSARSSCSSHGFIDRVVARPELRDELIGLLRLAAGPGRRSGGGPARRSTPIAAGFRPLSFLSSARRARRGTDAPATAPRPRRTPATSR